MYGETKEDGRAAWQTAYVTLASLALDEMGHMTLGSVRSNVTAGGHVESPAASLLQAHGQVCRQVPTPPAEAWKTLVDALDREHGPRCCQ
jgi:hypothetical protein